MDVSCPRCKTEYEFDDARVPEAGVTVKCTQCSHVFRVKRKGAGGVAQSIGPGPGGDEVLHTKPYGQTKWPDVHVAPPAPPRSAPPRPSATVEPLLPPAPPPREWKVRNAAGKVSQFQELTTLQKWIIERKVSRDDEISLTGETWKSLGAIAELSSFFQVVEEAQRGRELDAMAGQHATVPSIESPMAARPPPPEDDEAALASLPISAPRLRKGTPTVPPAPPSGLDPQVSLRPFPKLNTPIREIQSPQVRMNAPLGDERQPVRTAPLQERPIDERAVKMQAAPPHEDIEETDEEIATFSGVATGGAGKWWGLLLVAVGAFGGGAWYFLSWAPEQARLKAEREQQLWAAKEKEKAEAAKAVVDAGAAERTPDTTVAPVVVAPAIDAGAVVAMAMAMMTDAGLPLSAEVDAGRALTATGSEDAGAKAEPVRDYDYYLSQGDRLRDREKSEAALAAYGKAVDLSPDRAEAYAGRGLALLDLGRSEQGEAALQQALKLNRRYGPAIMGLAEAYKGMGENDKALEYYQLYLERLPNGLEANVAKSNIERLKKSP
ncbi:MAG: zinc-ribbon domain-containing protein [Myxococcaceae bacterium]|nr:zinc-ribbon domain-containing protein [Myxococcaceae bacterium]